MNTEIDFLAIGNYLFDKSELMYLKDKFAKGYKFKPD
jgi:hypothetical protein